MHFKYTRETATKILWPTGKYEPKPQAPIPRVIRIRDNEYDTLELYLKVTRSKNISLLAKYNAAIKTGHIKTEKNPLGGGRPPKYTYEERVWLADHSPQEIMEKYGVNLAHARVIKSYSKKYINGNT